MLSAVMQLFWEKGYDRVSMAEIVEVSGLNRYAIYQRWGGKADLYAVCLRQYCEMFVGTALAPLADGVGGLDDIRAAFDACLTVFDSGDARNGCMACRALVEPVRDAPPVRTQLESHFATMRTLFKDALGRALENGEIPADADTDALADFLVGIVQGAPLFGLRGMQKATANCYFRIALAGLRHRPEQ